MEFGLAAVTVITVICYLIGLMVKASPWSNDKYIPVVCGAAGGILGVAALCINLPDFPAGDPMTAVAIGIVSGLAATGVNQAIKQINK